jgi:hypothetical protein
MRLHGLRLGFRGHCLQSLDWLRAQLAGLHLVSPSDDAEVDVLFSFRLGKQLKGRRDFHLLYQGSRLCARSHQLDPLITSLRQELTLLLGLTSPGHLVLRGAVLQSGSQATTLLLGPALGGASTLLAEVARRGVRCGDPGYVLLRRRRAELQWLTGERAPLAGILYLSYRRHSRFTPRQLAPGAAALTIFGQAPGAALQAAMILEEAAHLAGRLPCWQATRGEASRHAASLVQFLRAQSLG